MTYGKVICYDNVVADESFGVKIDNPNLDKDINFTWLIIK